MADPASIMLEIGIIAIAGFIGALFASRLGVSVIIGYIVVGMLIGPHIHVQILGTSYDGLLSESEFLQNVSQLGLVLLLFFVGLEFSVAKMMKTKEAAAILAVTNLGVNLFAGFVIGTWLGWPVIDTIFLAGVISMSSSAITAKALIDLKRLGNAETDFLLGMVILESFLAMFLLTLVNGIIAPTGGAPASMEGLFLGVALFVGLFAFLALIVIPNTARLFEKIKSDEMFVLFALGVVFLSAALAEALRIPAIIGAFFIGMVFADTRLAGRLKVKMEALRDAFVAIFFLTFGMLIDPAALPAVLPILFVAVPLILLNDLLLTASLASFIGFSARASTAIGTSLVARNEEAILYASVGSRSIQGNDALSKAYAGTYLTPFAGILCIVMSSLAPLLMARSNRIANFFAQRLPASITFGAELIKRTLRTVILPGLLPLHRRHRVLQAALIVYAAWIIDLVLTTGLAHVVLSLLTPAVVLGVWGGIHRALQEPVRHTNYGTQAGPLARSTIERFVIRVVVGALTTIALVAIIWQYSWPLTLAILYGYFLLVVYTMKAVYRRLGLGRGQRSVPVRQAWPLRSARRRWAANGGRR